MFLHQLFFSVLQVKGIGESRPQKLSNNSSGRGVNRGVADHAGRSAAQINYDGNMHVPTVLLSLVRGILFVTY